MLGAIIVGVDGSETAKKAAETARDLAIAVGAPLHIVSAFDNGQAQLLVSGNDKWVISQEAQALNVAGNLAAELHLDNLAIAHFAERGTPGRALVEHASKHNAQLIVVGNKRMHGVGRVLGSVANSVAHNAPCDVYIAKTDD